MPKFSKRSKRELTTAHPLLQELFEFVVRRYDCSVLEGVRTMERQRELVAQGFSRTLNSKHLAKRDGYSHAVDVIPYPINWNDRPGMYRFGFYVLGVADALGISIRWGGDWDGDLDISDQTFFDLVHFELRSTKRRST